MRGSVLRSVLAFAFCTSLVPAAALAGGPGKAAAIDAEMWPYRCDSRAAFDALSLASILVYVRSLSALPDESEASIKAYCGIASADPLSVARWKSRTLALLAANYATASRNHEVASWLRPQGEADGATLVAAALSFGASIPEEVKPWHTAASAFFDTYAREQLRLAALFPKVSSEIDLFSPEERSGFEYADRQYLLTFDDGPTPAGGATDRTIDALRECQIPGLFFVLGENLRRRLAADGPAAVRQLYRGMDVGVHGMSHQSHAKLPQWRESVLSCKRLADTVRPAGMSPTISFRPPYGQRTDSAAAELLPSHCRIMLWNIDTQDWMASLEPEMILGRTLHLMALWRRGIILFHDIHPKAASVIPRLAAMVSGSGVVWVEPEQRAAESRAVSGPGR